ncbi:MAG: hypothetical protein WBW41_16105 [Verrucomicrobiia bacterium]
MKQQEMLLAPLRISRKFQIAEAKIGVATNGDCRSRISLPGFGVKRFNHRSVTFHDKSVYRGDAVKWAIVCDLQDERIVQTAGTLKHGTAARTTAVNGNAFSFASLGIDFVANFVGVSNDDKMFLRFPKAEDFLTIAGFTPVEQRLVVREIFGGRRKRQVEQFHFTVVLI